MYLKLFSYLFLFSTFLGVSQASDLSFSARLVNSDGSSVAGPVDLKFELAYSNNDSNILCTKELTDVGLSSGVFHANLELGTDECGDELFEVLENTPDGESLMMRVSDETDSDNVKTYPFQALNTVPMSVMSEVSQTISQMGASDGQVLKWDSGEWVPSSDEGEDGTITSITAGDGLYIDGGTITESGTISVKTGGIDEGMLAADSVTSGKIDDGTIQNADIGDGEIEYIKLNIGAEDIPNDRVDGLGSAALADVGTSAGTVMDAGAVPNCESNEKLQMSDGPTYLWSCEDESTGMDDTKLPLAGGTMSGGINMDGNEVTNLAAPDSAADATTKQYVDNGLADKANSTDLDDYVARAGDNMTGALKLDAQNELRLADSDSNEYVGLRSHANVVGNYVLTLPADTGSTDQVLSTDGSGNLSWSTPSSTAEPEGSAGGDLAGTYPDPTIDNSVIDNANLATGADIDAAKLGTGDVDNNEFNTLNGVTSSIQTQLDSKQDDLSAPTDATKYLDGTETWQTLDTSAVPENGDQYFTGDRARAAVVDDAIVDAETERAPSQNAVFDALAGKADNSDLDNYVLRAGDSMSGDLNMGSTNTVTNLAAPSVSSDATTKQYVDDELASYVELAGDNMTGPLQLDAQNELRLSDTGSTNYVALRSSGSVTTYTLTFPDSVGGADQVLTTDASGNLSWTTPSSTAEPEGSAGGDLAGTYPDPTIDNGVIDDANIATAADIDAAKLGTGDIDNNEFNTLNGVTSSIQTQLDNKQDNLSLPSDATQYLDGNGDWQTLDTDAVAEATNEYFTGDRARTAVVDDAIVDAEIERAPSQNAVFDALADKADNTDLDNYVEIGGDTMTGPLELPANGLTVGTNQLVTDSGNIGIGAATPSQKLHIKDGDIRVDETSTNSNAMLFLDSDSAEWRVETGGSSSGAAGKLAFREKTFGNALVIDNNNGNVGIGTTSPSTKLDVNGKVGAQDGFVSYEVPDGNSIEGTLPNTTGFKFFTAYDATDGPQSFANGFEIAQTTSGKKTQFASTWDEDDNNEVYAYIRGLDDNSDGNYSEWQELAVEGMLHNFHLGGRLGIGTETPNADLDVNGGISGKAFNSTTTPQRFEWGSTIISSDVDNQEGYFWNSVNFSENFTSPPLVFCTVQTVNGSDLPRVCDVKNVTSSGFDLGFCEAEDTGSAGTCDSHADEEVGWIAIGEDTGADLAEYYRSVENLEKGDVVEPDPNNPIFVRKWRKRSGLPPIGIVSTNPGKIMGEKTDDSYLVALSGRVPVKVSTESGPIEIGDRLARSKYPGKAKKTDEDDKQTIGIAMEHQNGSGKVMVFLDPQKVNHKDKEVEKLQEQVEMQKREIAQLKKNVQLLFEQAQ